MYGHNRYMERRELWKDINHYKMASEGTPLVVIGDFNAIKSKEEKLGG